MLLPVVLLLLLTEIFYGILYTNLSTQIVLFIVVSILASALYIAICLIVYRHADEMPGSIAAIVIGAGLIFRLTLIWLQPVASGDVYRYLWDGKVHVNGFNPYAHAPTDSALNGLHTGRLPQSMDFPNMRTIYPPFAEWVFAIGYAVGGENPLGIKFFLFIAECISAWLLVLLLRELKKPPAYIAFYVLCPLPVMQFMIDAHMDALAFPFILLALLFWSKRKTVVSSIALGFAIITKLLPIIFLPLLMKGESSKTKKTLLAGSVAVVGLAYLPYILWNGSPLESLGAYTSRWYFNGPVFDIILPFAGSNELAHIIVAALFIGWFLYIFTRNLSMLERLYFALIGFFLFSATVHPWYVTWIALLLPVIPRWSGVAYITLINLANIVVIDYKAFRIWHLPLSVEVLEYLPVVLILLWELRNALRSSEHGRII